MAIQTLNTIKNWFKTSLKPSQQQFWDTWDSFRHKFEKVPVKDIEGIDELLLTKADKTVLDNHLADKNAHAPQVNTDWNSESGFSQLLNKPEFKTINGEEIVGDGDITISSSIPTLNQVLNSDNKSLTQPIVFLDEEYSATIDSKSLSIDGPLGEGIQYNGDNINWSKGEKNLKLLFDGKSAGQNTFTFPEMPDSSAPYKLATDQVVSATQSGLVDNTSLQELGGVDKLINGVRVGAGNLQVTTNTVVGNNSLMATTTGGTNNTAIGRSVMPSATSAPANTGIGSFALNALTTGSSNLGIGASSLKLLTTGSFNMAVGNSTLGKLTTQSFNTAVGANAGGSVTGGKNTSIGYLANGSTSVTATGEFNISLGYQANKDITSGSSNVTIQSVNSGAELTSGNYNLIVKQGNVRPGIVTGNNNTIIGNATGLNTDDSNLAILSDGSGNVAIRKEADNRLLAPTLTNTLIDSGGAKSLVTKEYLEAKSGRMQDLQSVMETGSSYQDMDNFRVLGYFGNDIVAGGVNGGFNTNGEYTMLSNASSDQTSLSRLLLQRINGIVSDFIIPINKPSGTYTLATLDDITRGEISGTPKNIPRINDSGDGLIDSSIFETTNNVNINKSLSIDSGQTDVSGLILSSLIPSFTEVVYSPFVGNAPVSILPQDNGDFYFVSTALNLITKLDTNKTISGVGQGFTSLSRGQLVKIDNTLYTFDTGQTKVMVVDETVGVTASEFGILTDLPAGIATNVALAKSPEGGSSSQLYSAVSSNDGNIYVYKYASDGTKTLIGNFSGVTYAFDLAVNKSGDIYAHDGTALIKMTAAGVVSTVVTMNISSMTYDPLTDQIYLVSANDSNLYSIDYLSGGLSKVLKYNKYTEGATGANKVTANAGVIAIISRNTEIYKVDSDLNVKIVGTKDQTSDAIFSPFLNKIVWTNQTGNGILKEEGALKQNILQIGEGSEVKVCPEELATRAEIGLQALVDNNLNTATTSSGSTIELLAFNGSNNRFEINNGVSGEGHISSSMANGLGYVNFHSASTRSGINRYSNFLMSEGSLGFIIKRDNYTTTLRFQDPMYMDGADIVIPSLPTTRAYKVSVAEQFEYGTNMTLNGLEMSQQFSQAQKGDTVICKNTTPPLIYTKTAAGWITTVINSILE